MKISARLRPSSVQSLIAVIAFSIASTTSLDIGSLLPPPPAAFFASFADADADDDNDDREGVLLDTRDADPRARLGDKDFTASPEFLSSASAASIAAIDAAAAAAAAAETDDEFDVKSRVALMEAVVSPCPWPRLRRFSRRAIM